MQCVVNTNLEGNGSDTWTLELNAIQDIVRSKMRSHLLQSSPFHYKCAAHNRGALLGSRIQLTHSAAMLDKIF